MATIQNVRTINNPQKSYMWECEVQGLSLGTLANFQFYSKTVSIPQLSVEQTIINFKGNKTMFGGRDAAGHTVTLTTWDDENLTMHNYFSNWLQTMRDPVTGVGVTRDVYAANLILRLKSEDDTTVTTTVTLGNAFPTDISDISLTYDSSEPIEIQVTFSFDTRVIS